MDCEDAKCSHVAREGEWFTGFREPNIKPGGFPYKVKNFLTSWMSVKFWRSNTHLNKGQVNCLHNVNRFLHLPNTNVLTVAEGNWPQSTFTYTTVKYREGFNVTRRGTIKNPFNLTKYTIIFTIV